VLVAEGGIVGRFTLYVKDREPVYEYNWFTQACYRIAGPPRGGSRRPIALGEEALTPAEQATLKKMHAAAESARH
jgi:hypothetical protein